MTVKSNALTVANTATLLFDTATDTSAGATVVVRNDDATNLLYLGGSDVTTTNGYKLAVGAELVLPLQRGDALYGVSPDALGTAADVLVTGA